LEYGIIYELKTKITEKVKEEYKTILELKTNEIEEIRKKKKY
jgi:hypothetical protein